MRDPVIVFFDSDCLMCQGALRWLHRLDAEDRLRFAPLRGETSRQRGIDLEEDSMALVKDGEIYRASEAARLAFAEAGGIGKMLAGLIKLFPLKLRDAVYGVIARYRKRIFGSGVCDLPEEGYREKLLG